MTRLTVPSAIAGALVGASLMVFYVASLGPLPTHAAPLAQATATPTPTNTATPTITPTPTPRVATNWTREDQPDGTRCYIYDAGYARPAAVSCVVPVP